MKNNNNILFFCPLPPPLGGQALVSKIISEIIQPRFLINTNPKNRYLGNFIVILKCFWYFIFYKIDLVYFTCTRSKKGAIKDVILLSLCKVRKIKVINHLHGNEIMDLFTGGLMSEIILWSYKQIDTTIFVTKRQKNLMPASLVKMKKIVIPNCYDPILNNVQRDFSITNKQIKILYISFLMKSKGIFIALDVFRQIAKEYDNVSFHIAGEHRSHEFMHEREVKFLFEDKLKKLHKIYPQRFNYHGVVEGDKKLNLFTNSDILVFPTFFKTESFGLVNIEAMRTGNAIVTTNHNFLPDIVSNKEGVLVEPNNVKSTYNGVKYLLDNRDVLLKIQKHNIDHAKKLYAPEQFYNNILKLFSQFHKTKSNRF